MQNAFQMQGVPSVYGYWSFEPDIPRGPMITVFYKMEEKRVWNALYVLHDPG